MLAMRPRILTGLAIASLELLLSGALGCGSTPQDMWITKDPDAGADFDAPVREVKPQDTAPDESNDAGNDRSDGGGGGAGGAGGATGAAGEGGGGAGGAAGSGGSSGTGGAGGSN